MLAEAAGIQKIILAVGYTDLRKGVDSLAQLIGTKYNLNPFEKDILFLFCGRRTDRIKGLIWEGNGFLLLYKRLEDGAFSWPRTPEEAAQLTPEEYKQLMRGAESAASEDPGCSPEPCIIKSDCAKAAMGESIDIPAQIQPKGYWAYYAVHSLKDGILKQVIIDPRIKENNVVKTICLFVPAMKYIRS